MLNNFYQYHLNLDAKEVELILQQTEALIVHPSIGCPLIITPDTPIRFTLASQTPSLFTGFQTRRGEGPAVVPAHNDLVSKLRVNHCLQRIPWQQLWPGPEEVKATTGAEFLVYPDIESADSSIQISTPQSLADSSPLFLQGADGKAFAKIRPSTAALLQKAGFQYIFDITLTHHNTPCGLYNLAWMMGDMTAWLDHQTKAFFEPEDNLKAQYLAAHHYPNKADKIEGHTPPTNVYHSFHPILVTDKPHLGIGHLTDIHLSSRHRLFKQSTLKLLPGTPDKVSPPIGDMLHESFDSTSDLLTQMGQDEDIDIILLTGDFIDYQLNLNPGTVATGDNQKIWDLCALKEAHKKGSLNETHQQGVDNTLLLSLILETMTRYETVFFCVSGNHDNYAMPYGISPRIAPEWGDKSQNTLRANACIPADHNLTFQEAMLVFGPGYGDIIHHFNFDPKICDWFYLFLTPLTDYYFHYKDQTFIGMGWGDDEWFLNVGGSTLPQAVEQFTERQLALIENATEGHEGKTTVLFTHAPFVNYDPSLPLDTIGSFVCHDSFSEIIPAPVPQSPAQQDIIHFVETVAFDTMSLTDEITEGNSHYTEGTFQKNRGTVFYNTILNRKIDVVLSGHSHRSAIYTCELHPNKNRILTYGTPLTVDKRTLFDTHTALIVTGAGGPMGCQNLSGELSGCSLAKPCGTKVSFNGVPTVSKVLSSSTTQPRFAASLDLYDITQGPLFEIFESLSERPNKFEIKLRKIPETYGFIEDIVFYHYPYGKRTPQVIAGTLQCNRPRHYQYTFADKHFHHRCFMSGGKNFMVVMLNKKLATHPLFEQYDFSHPWIVPIVCHHFHVGHVKHRIERDPVHGEVPDFSWYVDS